MKNKPRSISPKTIDLLLDARRCTCKMELKLLEEVSLEDEFGRVDG